MKFMRSSAVMMMVSPRRFSSRDWSRWRMLDGVSSWWMVSIHESYSSRGIMTTSRCRDLMMTGTESSTQVLMVSARCCRASLYERDNGVMNKTYKFSVLLSSDLSEGGLTCFCLRSHAFCAILAACLAGHPGRFFVSSKS